MQALSFCDLGWSIERFLERCDTVYRIQHRDEGRFYFFGDLLRRNPSQKEALRRILRRLKRGGRVRFVFLKSRKLGISTMMLILLYDLIVHTPGINGGILSHTDAGTRIMRGILEGINKRMPNGLMLDVDFGSTGTAKVDTPRPDIGDARRGEASSIQSQTARGMSPFIGSTLHVVHFTELAHLRLPPDRQEILMTSVMNAIPPQGPSLVTIESTARGVDNLFHQYWILGEKNLGNDATREGDWESVFFPAHADPGARMTIEPGYDWMDWPEQDLVRENALVREFGVPLEYLRWRRSKVEELRWNFSRYNEEFPDRPQDAFLATTRGIINQEHIDAARAHILPGSSFHAELLGEHAPIGSPPVIFR
jgi:hypothetical protein